MTTPVDIPAALGLPPLPSTSPDSIGTLLWAREVIQKHRSTKYAVTDPKGIEELKAVNIGGVDQWLHIRGRNRDNPVLLMLHGGPGGPAIGFMDTMQRPWEDFFTVVQWDQRQTGKSYYPADDENAPLTVKQFIEDTEEVIDYLRAYLEKDKLFIIGTSWGTVLGMHMIKRKPECLHAYVGVGQAVNWLESEKAVYQRLLGHAQDNNENDLVEKVQSILATLNSDGPEKAKCIADNCDFARREMSRLAGEALMHHVQRDDVVQMYCFEKLISPHISSADLTNSAIGDAPAVLRAPYTFTADFMEHDWEKETGTSFNVPMFFFTGKHDWQTPVTLSDALFERINTSHKELIHFEESSHFVLNEEPGKVLINLVNKVLPFAEGEKGQQAAE